MYRIVLAAPQFSNVDYDDLNELFQSEGELYKKSTYDVLAYISTDIQMAQKLKQSRKDWDVLWCQYPSDIGLACFDMDSTLIKAEVIDELARSYGVYEQVAQITEQAMQGDLDFRQSFTTRLQLLKGMPEKAVVEVQRRLPFMEGAKTLLLTLREQGIETAILSGGFDIFARQIACELGVSSVIANQLNFQHGCLTGEVEGEIVDAVKKVDGLLSLKSGLIEPQMNVLAVGDGANDIPMLTVADIGIAVHAKPKVQQEAPMCINIGDLTLLLILLGIPKENWVVAS